MKSSYRLSKVTVLSPYVLITFTAVFSLNQLFLHYQYLPISSINNLQCHILVDPTMEDQPRNAATVVPFSGMLRRLAENPEAPLDRLSTTNVVKEAELLFRLFFLDLNP